MTEASLEQNMTAARHEHLVPGREIHIEEMRGYRFCEVGLITGTSEDNAIANIWNTTGACEPTPEQFEALDAGAIANANGALRTWLNPVRRWMFDRLEVREAGDDRTFGGITGTWMGVAGAATLLHATVQGSYYPGYVYRNNTFIFNSGSEVYLLDAPDGEVFVMQSVTSHWDPTLSEDNLAQLAEPGRPPRRLGLPYRDARPGPGGLVEPREPGTPSAGQPAQRLPGLGCRQGIQPASSRRLAAVGAAPVTWPSGSSPGSASVPGVRSGLR